MGVGQAVPAAELAPSIGISVGNGPVPQSRIRAAAVETVAAARKSGHRRVGACGSRLYNGVCRVEPPPAASDKWTSQSHFLPLSSRRVVGVPSELMD